eukprot:m.1657593 g.1657593  ORF g.1657593 m.1657593 type:complete len:58 (-) comp113263_c0_seq1:398-571(-)
MQVGCVKRAASNFFIHNHTGLCNPFLLSNSDLNTMKCIPSQKNDARFPFLEFISTDY